MRRSGWFVGFVVVYLVQGYTPAFGQFYPGGGYGGYRGYGGWGAAESNSQYIVGSQLAAQNRQAGQQAAMAQNAVVQSGIRNTLSNQADSRSNAILTQRQSTQDWWFQNQQQQAAERRAAEYRSPSPGAAGYGPALGTGNFVPAGEPPRVALDVIRWPTVLQDGAFASERTQVEAPYRRSPPKLSTPTASNFGTIVETVEEMQAVLEWKLSDSGLPTNEYNQAKAFLAKMHAEARQSATAIALPARPQ